jgi:hypothetical protein
VSDQRIGAATASARALNTPEFGDLPVYGHPDPGSSGGLPRTIAATFIAGMVVDASPAYTYHCGERTPPSTTTARRRQLRPRGTSRRAVLGQERRSL